LPRNPSDRLLAFMTVRVVAPQKWSWRPPILRYCRSGTVRTRQVQRRDTDLWDPRSRLGLTL